MLRKSEQFQNRSKTTPYAAMSRGGRRVTWVIAQPSWGLIIDNDLGMNGLISKD